MSDGGLALPRILWSTADDQAEGDCACPTALPPPRPGGPETGGAWQRASDLYQLPLPEAHQLVFAPRGPASVVVINAAALRLLDAYTTPRPLDEPAAHQLAVLGLLQRVGAPTAAPLATPDTLTAWLHVTNQCNLRCTYCYLSKTDEAMDEATGRAAVDGVIRSAVRRGFRAVKLKYTGGEALLNFGLVSRLHEYAQQRTQAQGLGLRAVVLSNGVALTPSQLDYLREAGIRLMISLDGLGAGHDAQRVFVNGQGSAAWVRRGVDRALAHGLPPTLSITVTRHTAPTLAEAVDFALARGLLFNLNFYRANDLASPADLWAEDEALIAGVRGAFAVIERALPRHPLIASLIDRANFSAPHDRPCGVGQSYLVVDQRGRVAACQMEIERTLGDVLAEDPLALVQAEAIGFRPRSVDEKEGCRDCAWRYWCGGGCPLLTQRVMGRSDVKSPYCRVYRALYPDALRLEGLRLLKWAAAD